MKCIIIEDEKAAADRLCRLIQCHLSHLLILKIITSVKEAIYFLKNNESPDLIFMDIQLQDGQAFKIFDLIEIKSPIIFTTAFDEYALRAHKNNAIDYLLKPIKEQELVAAVSKLEFDKTKLIRFQLHGDFDEITFVVRFGNRYYTTPMSEISYIQEIENLTIVARRDGIKFPVNVSLASFKKDLPVYKFTQISPTMLVNIDSIQHLEYIKNTPFLTLTAYPESRIKVEKKYVSEFNTWLEKEYS